MKILIADDTASDVIVLKSYLKQLGHEVIVATDGEEAVAAYQKFRNDLDLIILDVLMPNMDGHQAARAIHAVDTVQWIPIIFLSSRTDSEDIAAGIEAGGDDYLTKPVDKIVLTAKMQAMQRIATMRRKLADMNAKLELLVNLDGLTGAANRRYLDDYLDREIRRAWRNTARLSVCMIDVDLFKSFNDSFGHQAGDECLKRIVSVLQKIPQRPTDLIARYGGEEFCCVLPDTDEIAAEIIAGELRQAIEDASIGQAITGTERTVTVSIGVATLIPQDEEAAQKLIELADEALYQAKENGRNRVCCAG
jgi:diguanylate cyclase (GGDEF)-like protein